MERLDWFQDDLGVGGQSRLGGRRLRFLVEIIGDFLLLLHPTVLKGHNGDVTKGRMT